MRTLCSRRRVLAALGLAATGSLAGCSSGDESDRTPTATGTPTESGGPSSGLPAYADFVPPTDDGSVLFTQFDLAIEDGRQIGAPPETATDPLRYNSVTAAYVGGLLDLALLFSVDTGFGLGRLGTKQRALGIGTLGALAYDSVDLSGALSDVRADDSGATVRFEADDRAVVESAGGFVVGLTTDAVVFQPEPGVGSPDLLRSIVDARAGASQPKHAVDDGFASLLRRADTTGSVAVGYAPDSELGTLLGSRGSSADLARPTDGFEAATGGVFRIDLQNGEPPQPASATVTFPDSGLADAETVGASVGSAAAEQSVTADGRTVRVTGTYDWDALSEFEGNPLADRFGDS